MTYIPYMLGHDPHFMPPDEVWTGEEKERTRDESKPRVRLVDRITHWRDRCQHRARLAKMDHRLHDDIGMTRADVAHETSKHFWMA